MKINFSTAAKPKALMFLVSMLTLQGQLALAQSANVLPDNVDAAADSTTDGPIGFLGVNLAYNTNRGAVGGISYVSDRAFGLPSQLALSAEASQNDRRLNLSFGLDRVSPTGPQIGFSVYRVDSKASATFDFDTLSYGIRPKWTQSLSDTQQISIGLDLSNDTISGVKAGSSALIRKDQGTRTKVSLGFDYALMTEHNAANFGLSFNSLSTGGSFVKTEGSYAYGTDFADGRVVMQAKVMAGSMVMSGGGSNIGDRFFMGQSLVRGYDYGGIGPRDLAAGGAALGGMQYAGAKVDVMFPKLLPDQEVFVPGIFADTGALWGLDSTAGGAAGANAVDAGQYARQSAGLAMRFQFGKASANLYWSKPFNAQSYDRQSNLQLSFETKF